MKMVRLLSIKRVKAVKYKVLKDGYTVPSYVPFSTGGGI
jgi:hypothetical protein